VALPLICFALLILSHRTDSLDHQRQDASKSGLKVTVFAVIVPSISFDSIGIRILE